MENRFKKYVSIIIAILLTFIMIGIDLKGGHSYLFRTAVKIALFGVIPFALLKYRKIKMPVLKKDENYKKVLAFSIIVLLLLLISGILLLKLGFLSNAKYNLSSAVGVNEGNYIFVYLYVVLINGPLEEFFFRYGILKLVENKGSIYLSSLLFSLYHIGMLLNMFNFYIFVFSIIGLALVGLMFIKINKDSILNSVIVHMSANIGINTVGLLIMYELI